MPKQSTCVPGATLCSLDVRREGCGKGEGFVEPERCIPKSTALACIVLLPDCHWGSCWLVLLDRRFSSAGTAGTGDAALLAAAFESLLASRSLSLPYKVSD